MEPKHVLLICYEYSPFISPHAFRWTSMAEHWVSQGTKVDVITLGRSDLPILENIRGVNVHRVGGGIVEKLRLQVTRRSRMEYTSVTLKNVRQKQMSLLSRCRRILSSTIKLVHDYTWKKIYWPDFACLWIKPATAKANEQMQVQSFDTIITVSHPFSCHVVGKIMKKKYSELRWLIDVGDPFCLLFETPPNNHFLYRSLNRLYENHLFRLANHIAVTPEAREAYTSLFPEIANRIRVIQPMLSVTEFSGAFTPESFFANNGKKRLVFIGTLYRRIRNPDFLLRLFKMMRQVIGGDGLELHFIGNVSDCIDWFEKNDTEKSSVFLHGQLPHQRALQAMREADVLVNISNSTPYQLPSKVVEYASTGNPILNIARIEQDSSAMFFNQYPSSITVFEGEEVLKEKFVYELVQRLMTLRKMEEHELGKWISPFLMPSVAQTYKKILMDFPGVSSS